MFPFATEGLSKSEQIGLLVATPLTVCLVVAGKNARGLRERPASLADTRALAPEYGYAKNEAGRIPANVFRQIKLSRPGGPTRLP